MHPYILTDRGFCFVRDGEVQWLSLDEFAATDLAHKSEMAVLLGGVEYRKVNASAIDEEVNGALPGGFIVRKEHLKGGASLLMGVREEMLRALYDHVPKGAVKVCVPYGLAVRSYLLSRGIVLEGAIHIVVDDAGERVFITLIDGVEVVETRELVYQDGERLMDEVRRSEKRLLERSGSRGAVKVVSNHPSFINLFIKQFRAEDIIQVDGLLPVFEVLSKARFSVHFPSPADEFAKQRQEEWRRKIWRYLFPSLLTIGSGIFAVVISMAVSDALSRNESLKSVYLQQELVLREHSLLTYQDRLRSIKDISWEGSFAGLLESLPGDWLLQNIMWEAGLNTGEKVTVLVFKGENGVFDPHGIFKKAVVMNELISGRSALRIVSR